MQNSWIVLLPPIISLVVAFLTRRVVLSLFLGITSAVFIATNFSIAQTIVMVVQKIWLTTELSSLASWKTFWANYNLFICLFVFIIGVVVELINHTGAAATYSKFMGKRLKSAKYTEMSSLILSSFLFVDDYFNSLTTGSVMHSLTDRFKIPRVKLAFLVDSMASPLCVLVPVSCWSAAIIAPLRNAGITDIASKNVTVNTDTFWVYLNMIPFMFYSFIVIASAWFIVLNRISFGSMSKQEKIAQKTGNLFGGKKPIARKIREVSEYATENSSLWDFVVPIFMLFVSVMLGLLYSGGFYLFGGNNSLLRAFQNSEIAIALFLSSIFTLLFSILYFLLRKTLKPKEIPSIALEGINLMLPAIIILILAWTLGGLLSNDLNAGQYLAQILVGSVQVQFMPIMFFLISFITSFVTGSSWGTMAILIPIAVPMLFSFLNLPVPTAAENIPMLFPVLGAIVSGGIVGDHISPISDTTVMSSASTGSHHIDHVKTQMTYAIPIMCATGIAFLASGFLIKYSLFIGMIVPVGIGIIISFSSLQIMQFLYKRK